MPNVIVDTDDLEALLFATSGIKDLESALDQRKRNPLVSAAKGKLGAAHDRLSTVWRRAKREVDWPKRVVTEAEIEQLRSMFTAEDGKIRAFIVLDEHPMYFSQHLLLIECGPVWDGYQIEWPAPAESQFIIRHSGGLKWAARLSYYGFQILGATEADLIQPEKGGQSRITDKSGPPS